MWQEWLERTLTRGAIAPKAEPRLFDATLTALPAPANTNDREPPPSKKSAADRECMNAQ